MGLTLNSNSLTLESAGGGGSGLTEAQVKTLISDNTPWQFLTEITADASTELEYTTIPDTYSTIRIVYDHLTFSQNSFASVRVYFDGTEFTNTSYEMAGRASSGSTAANLSNSRAMWRVIDNYESGTNRHIMGHTDIGGLQPNVEKQMHSVVTSVHTNQPTTYFIGGYMTDGHASKRITGIKLFSDSGTFTSGSIKIYGRN